jgi:hypothetical protein
LELLTKSIQLDGSRDSNAPTFTCRVAALSDLQKLEEARAEADELTAARGEDPMALKAAGRVYGLMFRRDGSLEFLDRSKDLFLRAARLARPDRDVVAVLTQQVEIYVSLDLEFRALAIQDILDHLGATKAGSDPW